MTKVLLRYFQEAFSLTAEHVNVSRVDIEPHGVQVHLVPDKLVQKERVAGYMLQLLKSIDLQRNKIGHKYTKDIGPPSCGMCSLL